MDTLAELMRLGVVGDCSARTMEDPMVNPHSSFSGEAEPAAGPRRHIVLAPPIAELLHEVLEDALLDDTSVHQHRSPLDWVASFGVHLAILAILLVLPLYFTSGLDAQKLNLTFLAPPEMPPAPLHSAATSRAVRNPPARAFTPGKLIAPTFIPKAVVTTPDNNAAVPDEAFVGVPGGIPGGQVGGVLGGVLGGAMNGAAPPAPAVAAVPKAPVRVGGDVKPPRLLYGPDPEYPILAKQSRLSGVVIIEAVIDEHGNVKGMRVISGHPLLVPAALSAVSRRRYEPTVLDGEPTPIDLRVEISFSFS
jgi:periplasmic protein TonB